MFCIFPKNAAITVVTKVIPIIQLKRILVNSSGPYSLHVKITASKPIIRGIGNNVLNQWINLFHSLFLATL